MQAAKQRPQETHLVASQAMQPDFATFTREVTGGGVTVVVTGGAVIVCPAPVTVVVTVVPGPATVLVTELVMVDVTPGPVTVVVLPHALTRAMDPSAALPATNPASLRNSRLESSFGLLFGRFSFSSNFIDSFPFQIHD